MSFFVEKEKEYPKKSYRTTKVPTYPKQYRGKRIGGIFISDLKIYYRTSIIKAIWYWQIEGM